MAKIITRMRCNPPENNPTYFNYARTSEGLKPWDLDFKNDNCGAYDLIEAGVVLEYSVYPHNFHAGDGRFNNHFYSSQFTTGTSVDRHN